MYQEPSIIGASWLSEQSFCEQKLYLNKVKKIPLVATFSMKKGSAVHESKYEEFAKEAKPATWEEFFASDGLVVSREVELRHSGNNVILLGRVDEVACDKDGVYIIDDKPNDYAYIGIRKQIWAYCHLVENNFKALIEKNNKTVFAVLKNRDTGAVVWKEKYIGTHKEELLISLMRLRDVLTGKRQPEPTKNANKCKVCQYNSVCEFSLVKEKAEQT
ncbi:Dna2/Cas4 domain-containing protein [Candidatus Woesearchaeota archaeon]|nr:Dna2/Cas4 domain-containing protein [Candidatus Woesearchaeota archaeon]MBI2130620.1 Dna2/Cas4 domain-containing protein [Candidatus Woesearchaeota archaeon]